ncbi:MAG TPA: phosphoenolpyruvate synthase [Holosporales bacterium]|nr:phosphoenolpyruvate synthase [Holosporales bacterium]
MLTKARTLQNLRNTLRYGSVLPLSVFTVKDWDANRLACFDKIKSDLKDSDLFIVRSSSTKEDQNNNSSAGTFDSILNVKKDNFAEAISQVIESYGQNSSPQDEILIQPMLNNVTMSGVLFTHCPKTGSPYYIINYNLFGDTEAVTSGNGDCHTQFIAHNTNETLSHEFTALVSLTQELMEKLNNPSLDIEFAFNSEGDLFLFQARPLISKENTNNINNFKNTLGCIKERFQKSCVKHPYLYGDRTLLGIMPDWNPAEIIGIQPKPLALSLYKELITDGTWAYQRDNYGYRNLRSFPLLIDLVGLPYIDIRVSFNSFLPKGLPSDLAKRLTNYYLDELEQNPHLHDKVEFDILFSCYTFDLPQRLQKLKEYFFTDEDINTLSSSLKNLTNSIIHAEEGLWVKDAKKVDEVKRRHKEIFFNPDFDDLTKIYWLIEDCKRYGTLPFAGLARAAFIAAQLLQSMVDVEILTPEDHLAFLNSLDSISTNMTKDFTSFDREHFLQKYGHLRPGTYDILSSRYDETPDSYFDWKTEHTDKLRTNIEFRLSLSQMKLVEKLLKEHGLEHDVVGLFSFMKSAIEGRENSKFIFTKSLSDVLSLIKKYGAENSISPEDLAFLDIKDLIKSYSSSWDIKTEILNSIKASKENYKLTQQVILPPLITKAGDIESFELPEIHPNFITKNIVTANTLTDLEKTDNMENTIVFIPSADPGYDWLFTRKIAGFVTAYGGINSHMSIRAAELNIPAIIGAGKVLYEKWSAASKIHIDCEKQRVEIVA